MPIHQREMFQKFQTPTKLHNDYANGYTTDEESKLDSRQDQFLPSRVQTSSRACQSPIQLTLVVLYPGIRQPGHQTNHSPPFGA